MFDPDEKFTPKEGEHLKGRKAPRTAAPIPGSTSGTSVRFLMDRALAPDAELDVDGIIRRAQVAARLRPGMKLTVTREGDTEEFSGPDYGTAEVMSYLSGGSVAPALTVSGGFTFTRSGADVPADIELSATPVTTSAGNAPVVSAMNTVWTPAGGRYQDYAVEALGEGLASRQIRGLDRQNGEPYPCAEDFAAVSAVTLHVTMSADARYTGQEKSGVVGEAPLNRALAEVVKRQVTMWAANPANAAALTTWANAALQYARTRQKIQAAKDSSKPAKSAGRGTTLSLPDKYLPCMNTGRGSGAELHLCEGNSALGTIKAARDPQFQAAYPLRGKTINTHGATLTKCRKNAEFRDIESILGCGVRDNCDPAACRFDRIFFTTDADVDGYNISSGLLDMFIENFYPLVAAGMVYIAMPPLFIVSDPNGTNRRYCVDEAERDRTIAADLLSRGEALLDYTGNGSAEDIATFLDALDVTMDVADAVDTALEGLPSSKRPDVQRCKGLGEMTADDFAETVMDPATRTVFGVSYDPDTEAGTFDTVFGSSAAARRDWMRELAGNADLDVAM
jgi:DNA gyrase subunit B